ncbi:MAG TPA: FecR domain-containing protein [Gemmatimonadaceae bacterium]|nr:FecR domain-containing protein [Gemmatimonadaceae bacterium]
MSTVVNETIDSAVLLRYIEGDASVGERALVDRWMAADQRNRQEVERLTRAWELAALPRGPVWDIDALRREMTRQLDGEGHAAASAGATHAPRNTRTLALVPPTRRSWWATVPLRAAAAAVVVGAGVLLIRQPVVPPRPVASAPPPMRTYTTERGERAELRLADGSKVILGAASTLRIPASYDRPARDLFLEGQAYFEVTHEAAHPLRIHTARGVVEDVGTRFVVVAYDSDAAEHVAVSEGQVSLRGAESTAVMLGAGDVGRLAAGGEVTAVRHVSVDRYFSWIDGVIEFDNVTLGEALPVLERQFDLKIRLEDSSLARRRFTGSFTAGDMDQLLSGLAFLLDAKYERPGGGRELILAPR